MSQMIDDLKAIPGVIGAYTWHTTHGLVDNNLPSLFKSERLVEIANILVRIHSSGQKNFPDLGDTMVCFEEAATICRRLSLDNFLVMVCDSSINMNLLTMSLNLAIEAYEADETTQLSAVKGKTKAPSPEQLKKIKTTGLLAKPLQTMSNELFTIMGPMASIVFDEILLDWATTEPPSAARLPELLEGLCAETHDPEKAKQYRQLIQRRLGGTLNE
jgi:hypothetical protein